MIFQDVIQSKKIPLCQTIEKHGNYEINANL